MENKKHKGQFYIIGAIVLSFFFYAFISELILSSSLVSQQEEHFPKIKKVDQAVKNIEKSFEAYKQYASSTIDFAIDLQQYLLELQKIYGFRDARVNHMCKTGTCEFEIKISDNDVSLVQKYGNVPYNPDKLFNK